MLSATRPTQATFPRAPPVSTRCRSERVEPARLRPAVHT